MKLDGHRQHSTALGSIRSTAIGCIRLLSIAIGLFCEGAARADIAASPWAESAPPIRFESRSWVEGVLATNLQSIAIEGGRLPSNATWTNDVTHVVLNWVVVPSGVTLTITEDAIVKLCPGAGIKVEDGGTLRILGAEGAEAVMTTADDESVGGSLGELVPPQSGAIEGIRLQSSAATFSDNTHVRFTFSSAIFPTLAVQDASAKRSDGIARIPATVSGTARDTAFRVDWRAIDGSAKFGEDYLLSSGTLRWSKSSDGTKHIEIPLDAAMIRGSNTTFRVELTAHYACNVAVATAEVVVREFDFPGLVCSGWVGSAAVRFDGRDGLAGAVAHGIELLGEPDGSAATPWDTPALANGWQEIASQSGETTSVLVVNSQSIAVEGGRLQSNATWDASATHLVRHTVVVPSGCTLTVGQDAVVKFLPGTYIKVEDGGKLSVVGAKGHDAIFTAVNDDTAGAVIDCGDYTGQSMAFDGIRLQSSAATFQDNSYIQTRGFFWGAYPYVKLNDTVAFRDGGMANIPVTIASGTRNQAFSIDWVAVDGTATFGDDYTLASGTIEWTGTSQGTKTLQIPIVTDHVVGETTSFKIKISVCRACNPQGTGECTVTIRELDTLPLRASSGESGPVRFDDRESLGGRIMHGVETLGEPDGSAATPWNTAALADGWHEIAAQSGETASLLAINSQSIAVEGGRLQSNATWDASATHLVRHWVVVPSGKTLTVERGAVVKFCPEAGIRVEDGGKLVANGADGDDVIFTRWDDDTAGAAIPGGAFAGQSTAVGGIRLQSSAATFQDNGWFQMRGVSCNASNIGQLSIHGAEVSRKAGVAYVAVTVGGNTRNQSFTADWEAVPETAISGRDYTLASGRVTWSKSGDGTKWIAVPLNTKTETDERRTFTVRLKAVRGMDGAGAEATVEIREYEEGALGGGEVAFFPEGEGSAPFAIDEPIWKEPMFRHETEPIRMSGAWQNVADPAQTLVRLSWESESDAGVLAETPGNEPTTYTWRAEDWPVGSYTLRHDILDVESGRRLASYLKTFAVPTWEDVEMHGGTLTSNETWRAGTVHVVYETVVVPALYTILLEPGAIVKFLTGTGIVIEPGGGALFANGVVFTHINDDTVGGDTLNDGATLSPVMDAYTFTGDLTIGDESELRFKTQVPLSGTISGSRKLTRGSTYRVSGNVTIASGATLTIPAGTILKFDAGVQMTVNSGGTLLSDGTRAAPVVFTSIKDDEFGGDTNGDGDTTIPQPGDWEELRNAGGLVELHHSHVLYGGYGQYSNQGDAAVRTTGGTTTLDNCVVAHSFLRLLGRTGGTVSATNCILSDGRWGWDGAIAFVNGVVSDCTTGGIGGTAVNSVFHACETAVSGVSLDHCIAWECATGTAGATVADPMFRDAEAGDYRIREGSACIDAADSSAAPEKDTFGQKRWDFPAIANADAGAADIGVAECVPRDAASDVDLVPVSVTCDAASAKPGQTIFFHWTTANEGGEAVETEWWDELALVSASGRVTVLGEKVQSNRIVAGGETTGTGYFMVPVLAEGTYSIRLHVNSRHDVPEGTRTDNNALVADAVLEIVVDSAAVADGAVGTLSAGGTVVRKFDLEEDAPATLVRVRAPAGAAVRWGFGDAPISSSVSGTSSGTVSGSVGTAFGSAVIDEFGEVVFAVPAGTEALYVALESGGEVGAFDIVFEDGSLAVSSVSPATVPRSGRVTLRVSGAGFGEDAALAFVAPSGAEFSPLSLVRESAEVLWATVDCAALAAAGQAYGVRISSNGNEFFKPGSVAITAVEGKGVLDLKYSVPESVRPGGVFTFTVTYRNTGNIDMCVPLLTVQDSGNDAQNPIQFSLDGERFTPGGFQFVGKDVEGGFGPLHPDDGVTLFVKAKIPPANNGSTAIFVRANTECDIMAKYTTEVDRYLTPAMKAEFAATADPELASYGTRLAQVLGSNNGELVQNLAALARTFHENSGESMQLATDLVRASASGIEKASAESPSLSLMSPAVVTTVATARGQSEPTEPGMRFYDENVSVFDPHYVTVDTSFGPTVVRVEVRVTKEVDPDTGVYVWQGQWNRIEGVNPDLTGQDIAIVCHGNDDSLLQSEWTTKIAAALAATGKFGLVLGVNWEKEAFHGQSHSFVAKSAENIQPVAMFMRNELRKYGFNVSRTTFIGHSFGSHLLGLVSGGMGFRHIGLDTANTTPMMLSENGRNSVISGSAARKTEYYRTSPLYGRSDAYADENYIVCRKGGFCFKGDNANKHSDACDWFAENIASDDARKNGVGFWREYVDSPISRFVGGGKFIGVINADDNSYECIYPFTQEGMEKKQPRFPYPGNQSGWQDLYLKWTQSADLRIEFKTVFEQSGIPVFPKGVPHHIVLDVQDDCDITTAPRQLQKCLRVWFRNGENGEWIRAKDDIRQMSGRFEFDLTILPEWVGPNLPSSLNPHATTHYVKFEVSHGGGVLNEWRDYGDLYATDNAEVREIMIADSSVPVAIVNERADNGFRIRKTIQYKNEEEFDKAVKNGKTFDFTFDGFKSVAGGDGRRITRWTWRRETTSPVLGDKSTLKQTYSATANEDHPITLTVINDNGEESTVTGFLSVSCEIAKLGQPITQPKSIDPNEVSGPYGLGDPDTERFVQPGQWLDYTIYFENATNATAAAMQVRITEDLSEYLDWDSLELGEVVFAGETDRGLMGLHSGMSEYAVPGTNYLVRTTFTVHNGLANWYLRLVDPEGDEDGWPTDEWLYTYGGFLPPNTTNHVGEGHVSYRIKVRDDAPKNVRVDASADIVFDWNETIPTDPSWWNTIGHLPVDLTFDRNCDDVVLDMPTNGSYKCDAPDFGTPSREGWLFLGWADTNGVARNCGADLPYDTAALDLYAQWREEVETKFATIAVDGGVLIAGLADGQSCPSDLVIPATVEVGGRRVKVIGVADDAFKGKRAIQTLTVMEGVRTIGARSFMNCTSLASVSLPSTIESIGENAFYGCRLLSSVTIAAEIPPTLGADVFRSVSASGTLRVPTDVADAYATWPGSALGSAWTLEGFDPDEPVEPGEPEWTILPDQNLLLYAAGASDVRWAIEVDIDADGGLTLVQATGSVEPGEDFVLPDSVLDSDGNEYRIVAIGANADILDAGIFEGQEFVSVTIPESVETIAPCAFANCAGLREVVFAGDEPALRELGEGAFFSCTSLSAIDLAPLSSLERIGLLDAILGVFESCWYLPEVTLPATVETIGAYAFQDCSRLRAVRTGGGDAALTAIGERTFYNCDSLESVETGCLAALETMGDAAFGGDTAASAPKIARIALGTAIASLGADVFLNAAQLAEVTCLATNPPARDANAFRGMLRTGILRLPEQAIEDYTNETARAWVGAGAGKLTPWNGSTGWQVKSGDAGSMLREMESHLTDEEFEAFLALATLLGFTEEELCEVDHPAEQLAPELRIVSFNPDAAEYPLAIRFENGIDETPAAAFARLWSTSGEKIFVAVSDELGGVERRVPLLGIQSDDGLFRVNLGTAFHRDEPAQFVRIIIQ